VRAVEDGTARRRSDFVATEEPLEIRLRRGDRTVPLAVTMRTPGSDFDLAAGFLFTEGIVGGADDVLGIGYCLDAEPAPGARAGADPDPGAGEILTAGADKLPAPGAGQRFNVVSVELRPGLTVDLRRLERHFFTTSACGVCGKASLDQLERRGLVPVGAGPRVAADVLYRLPDDLRAAQGLFADTGGLHAAGLFDPEGRLLALREDVGRHNAVDKLIGWALLGRRLPLAEHVVLVSGRASFEIMQKCLAAGVPIVCAVSAPSSLALETARAFGMTLVGFLRGRRFNVYAGAERIVVL